MAPKAKENERSITSMQYPLTLYYRIYVEVLTASALNEQTVI